MTDHCNCQPCACTPVCACQGAAQACACGSACACVADCADCSCTPKDDSPAS